jgi:hypothetical protein
MVENHVFWFSKPIQNTNFERVPQGVEETYHYTFCILLQQWSLFIIEDN